MADLYSTAMLLGLVEAVKPNPQYLVDTFFGTIQTEESEDIHFDVIKRGRAVAPFVSPLVEGQVVESAGYSTNTFRPAYVKPKTPYNPRRALKRAAGETPLGRLSAQQRMELAMREILRDHRDRINRRLEVMAAEALVTGKVTVKGESYPEVVVDFGRDSSLTFAAKTGSAAWTNADSHPLEDIETMCQSVLKAEGLVITDIYMTIDAWNAFRKHEEVKSALDNRRIVAGNLSTATPSDVGAIFRGEIDGRNIWTYQDWYIDPSSGVETPMVADKYIFGVSRALGGVRAFGGIAVAEGENLRIVAEPMVPSTWVEKDPPLRIVMTQSAPLVVPTRPNATFSCKVVV